MSQANYIIICKGRIDVSSTNDPVQKIRYASACAADLVKHIEITGRLPEADAQAISNLQHEMMNVVAGEKPYDPRRFKPRNPDELVNEMFVLLDALEDKVSS